MKIASSFLEIQKKAKKKTHKLFYKNYEKDKMYEKWDNKHLFSRQKVWRGNTHQYTLQQRYIASQYQSYQYLK